MKILVALETCALPKYAERRKLIASTWAKRLPAQYEFKEFDGPMLGVGDTYQDLCSKTKAIAAYARDNDYDWLLIVDDDVFIHADRLTAPITGDYAGSVTINDSVPSYCYGAFYWLSKRAMGIVADAPLTSQPAEDQWVGDVMREHGIKPTHLSGYELWCCPCDICMAKWKVPTDFTAIAFTHRWMPEEYAKLEGLNG